LAYFCVCMTVVEESEETRREAEGYLQPVRDLVQPAEEAMFAGAVDYEKLPFLTGLLMKKVIQSPEGDFRDWEAIRAWAGGLPARLLEA
jgi:menaquinone-dependent protoporphyrinogen oxidase